MKNDTAHRSPLYWVFIALVVGFASLAGAYGQFQLPPLQDMVQANAGLNPTQYAQAFSAPLLPGLFLSLIAGLLIDRFGYRKMIAIALVISTIGAAGRALCNSYLPFLIAMALTGITPTFVQANNAKIMSNYVPPEKLSVAIGMVMLGGSAASFLGSSTTHLFPTTAAAYLFSGVLGIAAIILWLCCIRQKKHAATVDAEQQISIGVALKSVLRSKNVWRIGICMFFVQSFFMSVSSTAPSALKSLGYAPGTAGLLTSVLSIGSPLGCLLGAPLAIKTGRPKVCLMVISAVTAILFPLLWAANSIVLCALAFFLCGFCFGTGLITIASLPILLPEVGQKYAGTAGGLINTLQMAGAIIVSSWIIAPLANGNFRLQFLLASCSLGIGFLTMFLIPKLNVGKNK